MPIYLPGIIPEGMPMEPPPRIHRTIYNYTFLILQGTMRPFEYGLNKPAREAVFTTLSTKEKYKSTVFIDTFTNRFGDATGGLLFNSLLSFGLLLYAAPLAIIPLAIFLINLGWSISKNIDLVKSK